ncbi:MAG: ferritin family protein [Euryarchaeota archaeon]|nr:ferritin family protein [Euryarchaeota archaeon]
MFEKLKALGLKDILGYAIGSEEAANKFYMTLAKDTNVNELVAHKFEHFAHEEEIHKKVLVELHKKLYGDCAPVMPKGLPPFEGSVNVTTIYNMIEALDVAMASEDNAMRVYTYLAHHHKEYRRLFKHLAAKEKAHFHTLKIEKELYEEEIIEEGHNKAAPMPSYNDMYGRTHLSP